MAELADMLNEILSDPETGNKLRSFFDQRKMPPTEKPPKKPAPALPDGLDPAMLMKLSCIMKELNSDKGDPRTRLLYDLKPYISKERCRRVEEAAQMLKMLHIADVMLKDTGKDGD